MATLMNMESTLERLSEKYHGIDNYKSKKYSDNAIIFRDVLKAFFKHHFHKSNVSNMRAVITDFDGTLVKSNIVKYEINLIFDRDDAADYFVFWMNQNNMSLLKAQSMFLELCYEFNWSRKHSEKTARMAYNEFNEPLIEVFAKIKDKKVKLYIATMNFRSVVEEFNKILMNISNNNINFDNIIATEDMDLGNAHPNLFDVSRLITLSDGFINFHGKRIEHMTKLSAIRKELPTVSYDNTVFITDSGIDVGCISQFPTVKIDHKEDKDLIRSIGNCLGIYDKYFAFGSPEIIDYLDSLV